MTKRYLFLFLLLLALSAGAETNDSSLPCRAPHKGRTIPHDIEWDASRTYRQIVILFEFKDETFLDSDPKAYYQRLFNEKGYNEGAGPGCIADYILDQSHGLVHIQFDIFGPYKVSYPAKNEDLVYNEGMREKKEATQLFFEANPTMDYSIYDWNGDGAVEQIVYVHAGLGSDKKEPGYIWPNTSANSITAHTPDGLDVVMLSISAEAYVDGVRKKRGFGTTLHEYMHTFGLADVYPTAGQNEVFSIADEWDIMDGGNWINNGWCPPNLTAAEKIRLGWITPIELANDTSISDMKPVADGGSAYLIRHSKEEWILLENRQQTGWDYGIPGRGLTIWRVHWNQTRWDYNEVNDYKSYLELYFADNLTYVQWQERVPENKKYTLDPNMRSQWLSTAAYPWRTDSTSYVNDQLTNESTPALIMHTVNENGNRILNKHIKNIQMAEDGTISFDVEKDRSEGIENTGDDAKAVKRFENGQLIIVRDGKLYNALGIVVR